jgi:hypothetical protein
MGSSSPQMVVLCSSTQALSRGSAEFTFTAKRLLCSIVRVRKKEEHIFVNLQWKERDQVNLLDGFGLADKYECTLLPLLIDLVSSKPELELRKEDGIEEVIDRLRPSLRT